MPRVLLAGVSMRAAAASAVRAGFDVAVVDAFGDLDLPPAASRFTPPGGPAGFTVPAALRAARAVRCDAVAYGPAFEHCPRGVSALARGRELFGNAPDVLRRIRHPATLFSALERHGFPVPRTLPPGAHDGATAGHWLQKPLRSGGGHGIKPWLGEPLASADWYLQEHLDGVAGSIVFAAAAEAGGVQPLLVSRQLAGDHAFGATGSRYCGSIASSPGDLFGDGDAVVTCAAALARAVTREFGLVGVNGLDFIARDGVARPLEVNPRWCASMELIERAGGPSVFAAHVAACTGAVRDAAPLRRSGALGKAIVFARETCVAGDTHPWIEDDDLADIPVPGVRIPAGGPICTVFAEAETASACHAALVRRAVRVYAEVETWHAPGAPGPKPPEARSLKPEASV